LGKFERYLSIWVLLCIVAGIGLGFAVGDSIRVLSGWNVSTVNVPVALLVWLMIYPMMAQIDFSSIRNVSSNWKGLGLTIVVNWLIKPFTMAIFAYFFFAFLFKAILTPEEIEQYLAGAILLGAAPCTAMVFVWSYLTKGNPNYTLIQVAVNDLILLVAFIPIVGGLFSIFGIQVVNADQDLGIPYEALATSVIVFILIPLILGYLSNLFLRKFKGEDWFVQVFLARLKPISMFA
jgi:ACR3 family arsenite transporter